MHSYYTFLALDLAQRRTEEAATARLADRARAFRDLTRPGLIRRLRAAARALAGDLPAEPGRATGSDASSVGRRSLAVH